MGRGRGERVPVEEDEEHDQVVAERDHAVAHVALEPAAVVDLGRVVEAEPALRPAGELVDEPQRRRQRQREHAPVARAQQQQRHQHVRHDPRQHPLSPSKNSNTLTSEMARRESNVLILSENKIHQRYQTLRTGWYETWETRTPTSSDFCGCSGISFSDKKIINLCIRALPENEDLMNQFNNHLSSFTFYILSYM